MNNLIIPIEKIIRITSDSSILVICSISNSNEDVMNVNTDTAVNCRESLSIFPLFTRIDICFWMSCNLFLFEVVSLSSNFFVKAFFISLNLSAFNTRILFMRLPYLVGITSMNRPSPRLPKEAPTRSEEVSRYQMLQTQVRPFDVVLIE
jgi:hypothetical protein